MNPTAECPVCLDVNSDSYGILGDCRHVFCYNCISTWMRVAEAENVTCPLCRGAVNSVIRVEEYPTDQVKEEVLEKVRLFKNLMNRNGQQRLVELNFC